MKIYILTVMPYVIFKYLLYVTKCISCWSNVHMKNLLNGTWFIILISATRKIADTRQLN